VKKILLAGITGYLGSYVAKELLNRSYFLRAIARDTKRLEKKNIQPTEFIEAELTQPDSLKGCCKNIDVVISTVGITKQRDGLTYMDVDYQANLNLLNEAQNSGVDKFVYVSVLNGQRLRHLKICDAKEKFVEQLKRSGMDCCVIRPNGFFSDMEEIYSMARKGRVYLFGNGEWKANPIHGKDLAVACVDAIDNPVKEIDVGGPETLTHNEIALIAFDVLGVKHKISYIPDWARTAILNTMRIFTGSKIYGPIEFFLTVMSMDMLAPEYGIFTLKDHFDKLKRMSTEK
jgi:uncharacterized protein YbjT (DUF2867 family)